VGLVAQLRVVVFEDLVAKDVGRRKMVATYTQPKITTDDVVVDHPFGPVLHVGPAEVAL
jgi:hypothetical protein